MYNSKKGIGAFGEEVALEFLEQKGYLIIQKNFKCKLGEIDIIARDEDTIVFIEVKTRSSASYGFPVESILWRKKKKLVMLAKFYIKRFHLDGENFRFDVVSVMCEEGTVDIKLIKDAFWEV